MVGRDRRSDAAWQTSFVATSVLLGSSIDEALAALETSDSMDMSDVGMLADKLRDPRRAVRATALAEVAREVVREIAELSFR